MEESSLKLKVIIKAGKDADLEKLERLTYELRRELKYQDVEFIEIPEVRNGAPKGAKVAGVGALGTIFVTLFPSAVPHVMQSINTWVSSKSNAEVIFDLNGERLELKNIPSSERQKYISEFLARQKHCGG